MVPGSQPDYPNQNARVPKGTRFHHHVAQYTIELGIAKCENDNTRVVIPMTGKSESHSESPSSITIIERIIAFLESLGNQRGGIPFTGKHGGSGPGYHAQRPDNPVDADLLIAAMGMFGPAPGESQLDIAWAIKYLSDLLVELKQNEAERKTKEREILSKSNDHKDINNRSEYEVKEKEVMNKDKKKTEVRSQDYYDKWWDNGMWELTDSIAIEYITCKRDNLKFNEPNNSNKWYHYNKGDTITQVFNNVYRHIYERYDTKTQKMLPDTLYRLRIKSQLKYTKNNANK